MRFRILTTALELGSTAAVTAAAWQTDPRLGLTTAGVAGLALSWALCGAPMPRFRR